MPSDVTPPARLRLRGSEQGYVEIVASAGPGERVLVLPDRSGTLATEEFAATAVPDGSSPFALHAQEITEDVVISGSAALSAGPVVIADGVSVELVEEEETASGLPSTWTIL